MIKFMLVHTIIIFSFVVMGLTAHASDRLPPVVNPSAPTMPTIDALAEAPVLPDVKMHERTHPEKIIFGQMKLSETQPDLDAFAKASPFVLKAQEIDKSAMIFSEYNRIGNSFNLYDKNAPIVVQTTIRVDEYSSLQNIIVFDEFDETSFFKFDFYDHFVGIVPQGIESFGRLQLTKSNAERFFSRLNGQGSVVAEFILLPFYADGSNPLEVDAQNYWLMAAQVAEFRLWSSSDPADTHLLWFYRSPNYSPVDNQQINDLYMDTVIQ